MIPIHFIVFFPDFFMMNLTFLIKEKYFSIFFFGCTTYGILAPQPEELGSECTESYALDPFGNSWKTLHRRKKRTELDRKSDICVCLSFWKVSVMEESKQSLLFTLFSFFFRPLLISAFLGKFTARFEEGQWRRAIVYLMLLLYKDVTLARIAGFLEGCLLLRGIEVSAVWLETHPHIIPPGHFNLFLLVSRRILPGSCTRHDNPSFLSPMEFWVVLFNLGFTGIFLGL